MRFQLSKRSKPASIGSLITRSSFHSHAAGRVALLTSSPPPPAWWHCDHGPRCPATPRWTAPAAHMPRAGPPTNARVRHMRKRPSHSSRALHANEGSSCWICCISRNTWALFGCCRIHFNPCVLVWIGVEFSSSSTPIHLNTCGLT